MHLFRSGLHQNDVDSCPRHLLHNFPVTQPAVLSAAGWVGQVCSSQSIPSVSTLSCGHINPTMARIGCSRQIPADVVAAWSLCGPIRRCRISSLVPHPAYLRDSPTYPCPSARVAPCSCPCLFQGCRVRPLPCSHTAIVHCWPVASQLLARYLLWQYYRTICSSMLMLPSKIWQCPARFLLALAHAASAFSSHPPTPSWTRYADTRWRCCAIERRIALTPSNWRLAQLPGLGSQQTI